MLSVRHVKIVTLRDMVAYYLQIISFLTFPVLTQTFGERVFRHIAQAACLCLVTIFLLYEDYRLTINGLVFSISATSLTGLVNFFLSRDSAYASLRQAQSESWAIFLPVTIVLTTTVSLTFMVLKEQALHGAVLEDFIPALVINLLTSGLAITLGGSFFFDLNTLLPYSERDTVVSHLNFTGMTAAGALTCQSLAYSSPWQILVYLIAAILVLPDQDQGAVSWLNRQFRTISPWHRNETSLWPETAEQDELLGAEQPEEPTKQDNPSVRVLFYNLLENGILSTIIIVLVWVLFITLNFSMAMTETPFPAPHLDKTYTAPSRLDVVISMYEESPSLIQETMTRLHAIPRIATLQPRLRIYTKASFPNTTHLQALTNATTITHLPNRGREGETYLHHILTHWDALATHTIFLQAEIHNPREVFPRIRDYFVPETGMLSLGFSSAPCACDTCGDRFGWSDSSGVIADVYEQVHHTSCVGGEPITLSYKGQFIASAARIRGAGRSVYQGLEDALVDMDSWTHGDEYLDGREDSLNAPYLGFTVERLWGVLLQCSGRRLAERCPTLLSGTSRLGEKGDCQCFD